MPINRFIPFCLIANLVHWACYERNYSVLVIISESIVPITTEEGKLIQNAFSPPQQSQRNNVILQELNVMQEGIVKTLNQVLVTIQSG